MLRKLKIKYKILILVFIITSASVGVYTTYSYKFSREAEMKQIDSLLLAIGNGTNNLVGEEYHERITDASSLTQEEYAVYAHKLTDYAHRVNAKYVYSYVEHQGEMHFTSSSLNEDDIKNNKVDPFFFRYNDSEDPLLVQNQYYVPFRTGQPHYAEYRDFYGPVRSIFIPFRTKSGKPYIVAVDYSIGYVETRLNNVRNFFILIGVAIFLGAILVAYLLIVKLSEPINKLAETTHELITNDFCLSDKTQNYLVKFSTDFKDEVGELSGAFLTMQRSLQKYLKELQETTAIKERIESEIQIASQIQLNMVPREFPPFPDKKGFDIFATMKPAKMVGGDLYNYFFIDDRHLCFTIGDVSGKGVPAALFMAITNTLLKALSQGSLSPSLIMENINRELCRENDQSMFVTLLLGILDIGTGEIQFANAGHNPPILMRDKVWPEYLKLKPGIAAGVFEEAVYQTETLTLGSNDSLLLYTDGVTEAMDVRGVLYNEQRLKELVEGVGAGNTVGLVQAIMEDLARYSTGAEQSDDITILNLRYNRPC